MKSPYKRIIEQAEKALRNEPVKELENEPLGLYGVTHTELRLGNIIAVARKALEKEEDEDA